MGRQVIDFKPTPQSSGEDKSKKLEVKRKKKELIEKFEMIYQKVHNKLENPLKVICFN